MYLLDRDADNCLHLTEFLSPAVPPYAILSHTWGPDEVSFEDVKNKKRRYEGKAGYKKIDFCLRRAAADGVQYCWVDTCCIDRADAAALQNAINRMFIWYKQAHKCYAFLSDVPNKAFADSRWFTRGWTLQELIAPSEVDFFSSDGRLIGNKQSMIKDLARITEMPEQALRGIALSEYTFEERRRWTGQREAKYPEDLAYSLLGIFEVSMIPNYGEGKERAFARLRREYEGVTEAIQGAGGARLSAERVFTLPFALPGAPIIASFVGRADEMTQLREALPFTGTRETAVLHGLGGIGKTQLAIEYAKTRRADYTAVLWLDGRDEASLRQSFAGAARRLSRAHESLVELQRAAESADADRAVDTVLSWLDDAGNSKWLLIIDSIDAPHVPSVVDGLYDPRRYLPARLHGHVLITTRSSQLGIGKQVKLQKVDSAEECLAILKAASQRSEIEYDASVYPLIKRLDGLPLALSAAGHYLNQTAVSPAEYLNLYERSWVELHQSLPGLPEHQGRTLQTTWELSRRQVAARSPEAHQLLRLWGSFAGQDIWYELLAAGKEDAPEWFMTVTKSRINFDTHMRVLSDHGLVEAQQDPVGYRMHDCVYDWAREIVSKYTAYIDGGKDGDDDRVDGEYDNRGEEAGLALRCISLAVPYSHEVEYWVTQRRLLSHAHSWVRRWGTQEQGDTQYMYLHHLGVLYSDQSRLTEAEAMYERALAGKEKALGREHTSTLDTVNSLGILYCHQGRLAEAEAMHERALAGYEKALGSEHPSARRAANNLRSLYSPDGRREGVKESEDKGKSKLNRVRIDKSSDVVTGQSSLLRKTFGFGKFFSQIRIKKGKRDDKNGGEDERQQAD